MGRKCSTVFDGKSCNNSCYVTSDNEGPIFSFPPGEERERWVNVLPNFICVNKITRWMGICEKHWKPGYEYKIIPGGKKPIHPPTEFGIMHISLRRQSVDPSHSRDVGNRNVLSKERRRVSDAKEKEKDKIRSWESLIAYCNSLGLNIVSNL